MLHLEQRKISDLPAEIWSRYIPDTTKASESKL
jgi:hypothetical protein